MIAQSPPFRMPRARYAVVACFCFCSLIPAISQAQFEGSGLSSAPETLEIREVREGFAIMARSDRAVATPPPPTSRLGRTVRLDTRLIMGQLPRQFGIPETRHAAR